MLERFRDISRKLGKVPSLVYVLIYLGLIPAFAVLYSFALGDDFYHSTVQYEYHSLNVAEKRVRNDLQHALLDDWENAIEKSACGDWKLDKGTRIMGITTRNDTIFVSLRVIFTLDNGNLESFPYRVVVWL